MFCVGTRTPSAAWHVAGEQVTFFFLAEPAGSMYESTAIRPIRSFLKLSSFCGRARHALHITAALFSGHMPAMSATLTKEDVSPPVACRARRCDIQYAL